MRKQPVDGTQGAETRKGDTERESGTHRDLLVVFIFCTVNKNALSSSPESCIWVLLSLIPTGCQRSRDTNRIE